MKVVVVVVKEGESRQHTKTKAGIIHMTAQ